MIKELKFKTDVLIKSYQYYAYPISILLSTKNVEEELLLLNFFTNVFRGKSMQYYESNYTKWNCLKIKHLNLTKKKFINQLIQLIDSDNYIHLIEVNEYFIPNRKAFYKENYIHDILIIGYDKTDQTFLSVGFNKNNRFVKEKINFDNLVSACFYKKTKNISNLISIKPIDVEFNVNLEKILKEFKNYILCRDLDMSEYEIGNYKFGFDSYKSLNESFSLYFKGIYTSMPALKQDIYFIYEHKNIIYYKLKYLYKYNLISLDILEKYYFIKKESEIIKNLYIKFLITQNYIYIKKISFKLDKMLKEEEKVLEEIGVQLGLR